MTKLFLIIIFIFTTSCSTTKSLWANRYLDGFSQFIFSEDGSQIILIGDKYDYVIDDVTGKILALASWEHRTALYFDAANSNVKVYNDGNFTGTITIKTIYQSLSPEVYQYLISLGFVDNRRENLYLQLKIQGKRYKSTPRLKSFASKLDKRYSLQIEAQNTIGGSAGKLVVTPFTMVLDVFKIILTPIIMW